MKKTLLFCAVAALSVTSCKKDDDDTTASGTFTVTVENTFEHHDYFASGGTELITPGNEWTLSFRAGQGHRLQLSTMLVESNDLFYAPEIGGIALFDGSGNPITGDITSSFVLWDAGTEVNEEPGVGPNQPLRQTGPNTGMDENGTVELLSDIDDGFMYPPVNEVFMATLAHDGGTLFTLTISNISDGFALPSPLAPGLWVIQSEGQQPLFTAGEPASNGLEGLAEDGANTEAVDTYAALSGLVSPFAPGAFSVAASNGIFTSGATSSDALEALAEDGNAAGFARIFNTPYGASAPGPIFPEDSYQFSFTATEGDRLSLATMLVQSNDWFVGIDAANLFSNGSALTGDITHLARLYDAGTEVDMYSGAGADQPPRQSGPDTGGEEGETTMEENDPSTNVPTVANMVQISISYTE